MEFSYPKTFNLEAKETGSKRRSGYDIRRIEMAALPDRFDASRLVTLEYYAPRSDSGKPVVLVLPISGGGYDLEQ